MNARSFGNPARMASVALLILLAPTAMAAATDLSTVPLWANLTSTVKPNILFTLDDSGSMADDVLPDDASYRARPVYRAWDSTLFWPQFGRLTSQCNGLAYDPKTSYLRRVDSTGADIDPSSPTAADITSLLETNDASGQTAWPQWLKAASTVSSGTLSVVVNSSAVDGSSYFAKLPVTIYDWNRKGRYMVGIVTAWDATTKTLTIDVKHARDSGAYEAPVVALGVPTDQLYYTYTESTSVTGWQPKMSYSYPVASLDTTTPFYQQCSSTIVPAGKGYDFFTPHIMTPSHPQATNYWLWKRLYGTRMKAMQTLMSRAFRALDTRHRVGFTTISKKDVAAGDEMLHVSDFDDAQKASFYTSLYAARPGGNTPLRGALQKAGRYYAKKMPDQTYDPVQYSCQKNFLILSTDGYWNTYDEAADYGPYTIDGKATVGNQDGLGTLRPMFEGGAKTETKTYDRTQTVTTTTTTTTPINYVATTGTKKVETKKAYSLVTSGSCGGSKPYVLKTVTSTRTTLIDWLVQTYTTRIDTAKTVVTTPIVRTVTTTYSADDAPTTTTEEKPGTPKSTPTNTTNYVISSDGPKLIAGDWVDATTIGTTCINSSSKPSDGSNTSSNAVSTTTGSKSTPTGDQVVEKAETVDEGTLVLRSTSTATTGATSDTLADVAMYYYKTDLRTEALDNCTGSLDKDVCANNVKVVEGDAYDNASWQHLTTYTIGLGNPGTLRFNPNYKSNTPTDPKDYFDLGDDFVGRPRNKRDWSNPSSGGATRIDDMWHAAVNGRGTYFSASDVSSLAEGLTKALLSIEKDFGTSAAAATSTLQPVTGDNGVYISQFTSPFWTGDLRKYRFNSDGTVTTKTSSGTDIVDTAVWSASDKLTTSTARNIYFFRPGSGAMGSLVPFEAASMNDTEKALFADACSKAVVSERLFQCKEADATSLASLNSASTMVSYLRGQPQTGYRGRTAVLGDLVNSAPVFIGAPGFKYTENDYGTYVTKHAKRQRVLLVGGNDGMLHAFKDNDESDPTDASGGTELWAYVPRLVMDKMYKLADSQYNSKHQFYVDGTPVVADIYTGGATPTWKTIAVGGLNGGGRGFYALDVTDPTKPVALWEFGPGNLPAGEQDRLGYSYGNPIVTKAKDGTWIVAVTSGYNNPDGGGYVFILNAMTGALIKTLSTGVGDSSNPSGLAKLNAWIESVEENRALRLYGGDLTGRLYRFDFDGLLKLPKDVVELAQFKIAADPETSTSAAAQPITTMPMLAEFNANGAIRRVVYVGTGRFLGASDVGTADQQSIYAVVDNLTATGLGDVRAGTDLVKQPVDTTTSPRTVGSKDTLMNWGEKKGWFADLPTSKERVNVDPLLVANTLLMVGNIPGTMSSDCEKPGDNQSWLYSFNIITGSGTSVGLGTLVAGLGAIQTPPKDDGSGGGDIVGVVTDTKGRIISPKITPLTTSGEPARRSTWRELR